MEAQSYNFEEEDVFLFSQNPIAQSPLARTQSSSDQVESLEDFLENYKGRKPLIGECSHMSVRSQCTPDEIKNKLND